MATYGDAWYQRASVNALLDSTWQKTTAKELFEKYIEITLADTAKFNKFKASLSKTIALSYDYLGKYYYQKDLKNECKEMLKKSLEYDPKNQVAIDILKSLK
jgi:transcription elongation factor GreA-like protein